MAKKTNAQQSARSRRAMGIARVMRKPKKETTHEKRLPIGIRVLNLEKRVERLMERVAELESKATPVETRW